MVSTNPYAHIEDLGQSYIDVRPGYPDTLIDSLGINRESKVIDIGAGTGKLTAQLLERTQLVWALEPSTEISSGFFNALPSFPTHHFIQNTAEDTGLPRRSFDFATYGQCWHWLSAPAASREAARILRSHGVVAILFNQLDVSVPWVLQLSRIMRSGDVQRVSKPPQLTRDFSKPELTLTNWTDTRSVAEILTLGTTRASWIKSSPENRIRMQANLRWYLCEELGYGIAEKVQLPYQTQLWTAVKQY